MTNISIYSVSNLNSYIKDMFAQDHVLRLVCVREEISKVTYHYAGHIYFTLKDEGAAISCVIYNWKNLNIPFKLSEGQQVLTKGTVMAFPRDGKYQLKVTAIREEGVGNLYEEFERLKIKLDEMGMFAQEYKQPIPRYIKRLGVVTAPTGAVIQDIMQVSKRRNPGIEIILYPCLVQGENAAPTIVRGIEVLDRAGVDTIIVGRGGGSMEDLWCFNDERVAQAIFDCTTPIISAVGHQTDYTIADFVSDLRAPTPSAAAELAVYDMSGTLKQVSDCEQRLTRSIKHRISERRMQLDKYALKLKTLSPENILKDQKKRTESDEQKLKQAMQRLLENRRHRLMLATERLKGLSPLEKLSQGYAWVSDEKGQNINDIHKVNIGDKLKISVKNGFINATVSEVFGDGQ